jgi:hypothetical protein
MTTILTLGLLALAVSFGYGAESVRRARLGTKSLEMELRGQVIRHD